VTHLLKRLSTVCFLCLFVISQAKSTLLSGSRAPSFVLTDINGRSYDLDQLANEGKSIILHFGTTWCSTCWNLNQSQLLADIDLKYGKKGSDELVILYVESDLNTDLNCLKGKEGCNSDTYGDWTRDSRYPIIDLDEESIKLLDDYEVEFYPMVYIITPDQRAFQIDITEEFDIEKYFKESIQLTAEPIIEFNDCTGLSTISLAVDGGNGRLFFDWSNGSKQSYIEKVESGKYGVTVTDENGVRVEKQIVVAPSKNPIAIEQEVLTDVSAPTIEDGAIYIKASGGIGSLSYYWDHGDSGNSISGLPAGTYHLSILDEGDCEIRKSYTIKEDPSAVDRTKKEVVDFKVKVYPNPVANYLNIESQETIRKISIIDNNGTLASNATITETETQFLDVAHLEPGRYNLMIVTDESTLTRPFIKAR
jgi:hypothetical protein